MGIKEDIGLVNDDYQWLGSMFYFGTPAILHLLPEPITDTFQAISHGNIQQTDFYSASLLLNTPPSAS